MNTAADRVLRRLEEGRAQRAAQLAAALRIPVSSVHGTRVAHPVGARVFDPLTGEEGIVVAATTENIVVPTSE